MNRTDANSGTSSPQGKVMKRSTLGVGDQRLRSYKAKDRFRGLAEASFSISLGRVGFLVFVKVIFNDVANLNRPHSRIQ